MDLPVKVSTNPQAGSRLVIRALRLYASTRYLSRAITVVRNPEYFPHSWLIPSLFAERYQTLPEKSELWSDSQIGCLRHGMCVSATTFSARLVRPLECAGHGYHSDFLLRTSPPVRYFWARLYCRQL